jgi:hypothetical protein
MMMIPLCMYVETIVLPRQARGKHIEKKTQDRTPLIQQEEEENRGGGRGVDEGAILAPRPPWQLISRLNEFEAARAVRVSEEECLLTHEPASQPASQPARRDSSTSCYVSSVSSGSGGGKKASNETTR